MSRPGRAASPDEASKTPMASQASTAVPGLRALRRPSLTTPFALILVGLIVFWLIENLVRTPSDFYANLIFGVTNGLLYALIAIGYTLVYGILELINFAHGDVFMLGAMMAATVLAGKLFGITLFGLNGTESAAVWVPAVLVSLVVSMAFCGTLNASIEFIAYRPLRGAPRLAPLITAI